MRLITRLAGLVLLAAAMLPTVIFAALLSYILTITGLFVLRRTRPDLRRPTGLSASPFSLLPISLLRDSWKSCYTNPITPVRDCSSCCLGSRYTSYGEERRRYEPVSH